MLEFARWKYVVVVVVTLLALVFAAPNFFGTDIALQVARKDRAVIDDAGRKSVEDALKAKGIRYKGDYVEGERMVITFQDVNSQLAARDAVNDALSQTFVSALASAPRAPDIFRRLGLRPMPLGLDLRGGLFLLYQVDVNDAVRQLVESYEQDFRRALTTASISFADAEPLTNDAGVASGVRVSFAAGANLAAAREVMQKVVSDLTYSVSDGGSVPYIDATLTTAQITERQRNAIQLNMNSLRNRVNALGVTEPEVRQQGVDRISVALPGVLNSAEVKDILGRVATLEFRMTDVANSVQDAVARGRAPVGSRIYYHRDGRPTLLKREVIATGDQLIDARSTATQEGPAVAIRLNAQAGDEMLRITQANLGKPMAVVLIEKTREKAFVNGQEVEREVTKQEVISEATIRGVFSNQFNITGVGQGEAQTLALLMRSGQLAAKQFIVSERPIGPSLGAENIRSGVRALIIGSTALFVFMILYYHLFGVVASLVLVVNVVLLTALLSLMKASLSLPGIAGILLTVGMAVDANVIIYERIREELRNGVTPQASIRAGFEKAWTAIWDSNVTTFIAGLILWVFGTGPIRNFATVLMLGILTSMFTAMLGSRALLTLIYGGAKKPAKLSIG
ncbi:MAG TPA: protein translocase subunit SecD [Steroidobacteraceae bacterium]|nr:protein translocase subunit SecD [Steroidobacteraceae bacterium]